MTKPKLALVRPSARKPQTPEPSAAAAARIEKGEARLVVQLPGDLHRAVKVRAAQRNMTIRQYILMLLHEDGVDVE